MMNVAQSRKTINFSLTNTPFPGTGETLLFIVTSDNPLKDHRMEQLNNLSKGRLFEKMERTKFKGEKKETLVLDIDGGYKQLIVIGAGKLQQLNRAVLQNCVADAVRILNGQKNKSFSLFVQKEWGNDMLAIGESIALATYLANYHFSKYKSQEFTKGPSEIEEVVVCIEPSLATNTIQRELKTGFIKGEVVASGVELSRNLVNEPASHIYPITLAEEAKRIANESEGRITVKVLDEKQCEAMGMGAYLGVAQGSDNKPQFIVMHFTPKLSKKNKRRICLVGKSVTFDTGGYQIKPDMYMNDMKIDMGGGATMLGVFRALSDWDEKKYGEINYDVYAVLPACENMISGRAFRPGDVLTAMNGKTIEVKHTDAEGRLTLADALSYADRELKADIVIDFATLTGAIMVALGYQIAGAFGNNQEMVDSFLECAKKQGEEVWQMPLPDFYKEDIKGDVADINNLGKDRYGGAITAALFLQEFVGDMKWMHIDIAGVAYMDTAASGIRPKGATGWGVRTLLQVLTSTNL